MPWVSWRKRPRSDVPQVGQNCGARKLEFEVLLERLERRTLCPRFLLPNSWVASVVFSSPFSTVKVLGAGRTHRYAFCPR